MWLGGCKTLRLILELGQAVYITLSSRIDGREDMDRYIPLTDTFTEIIWHRLSGWYLPGLRDIREAERILKIRLKVKDH